MWDNKAEKKKLLENLKGLEGNKLVHILCCFVFSVIENINTVY